MALTDFLEALLEDWDNVEAMLSVAERVEVHRRAHLAEPFAWNKHALRPAGDPADAGGYLAQALAGRLADDHRAWEGLDAERSRFQRSRATDHQLVVMQRLLVNVRDGLTGPDAAADAVSDYLINATQARIIANSFEWRGEFQFLDGALYIPGAEANYYPRFQFQLAPVPWLADDTEQTMAWLAASMTVAPEVQFSWAVHPQVLNSREFLDPESDPLGSISWWLTVNSWLGAEPASLLGTARESEILPALAQLDNDSW